MLQHSLITAASQPHRQRTAAPLLPPVLVLIGPHGAGKTTLGRRVAARLGVPFDDELGRRLREAALAANPDAHALHSQPDFDREVMARELERDRSHLHARVVETWHPGNLAFAEQRSPEVAALYRERLRLVPRSNVLVQPLTLSLESSLARLSEPGTTPEETVRFFREVGQRSIALARQLQLQLLSPLATDQDDPDSLAEIVVSRFQSWEKTRALMALR